MMRQLLMFAFSMAMIGLMSERAIASFEQFEAFKQSVGGKTAENAGDIELLVEIESLVRDLHQDAFRKAGGDLPGVVRREERFAEALSLSAKRFGAMVPATLIFGTEDASFLRQACLNQIAAYREYRTEYAPLLCQIYMFLRSYPTRTPLVIERGWARSPADLMVVARAMAAAVGEPGFDVAMATRARDAAYFDKLLASLLQAAILRGGEPGRVSILLATKAILDAVPQK